MGVRKPTVPSTISMPMSRCNPMAPSARLKSSRKFERSGRHARRRRRPSVRHKRRGSAPLQLPRLKMARARDLMERRMRRINLARSSCLRSVTSLRNILHRLRLGCLRRAWPITTQITCIRAIHRIHPTRRRVRTCTANRQMGRSLKVTKSLSRTVLEEGSHQGQNFIQWKGKGKLGCTKNWIYCIKWYFLPV